MGANPARASSPLCIMSPLFLVLEIPQELSSFLSLGRPPPPPPPPPPHTALVHHVLLLHPHRSQPPPPPPLCGILPVLLFRSQIQFSNSSSFSSRSCVACSPVIPSRRGRRPLCISGRGSRSHSVTLINSRAQGRDCSSRERATEILLLSERSPIEQRALAS